MEYNIHNSFRDVVDELYTESLYHKYCMKNPDDVDKLDINKLLDFI
jgi:hypothetical protein